MTDIIKRLRRTAGLGIIDGGLMQEAAAEIEKLRGERAGDQQRLFHYEGTIERLQAELFESREVVRIRTLLLDQQVGTPCEQIRHMQEVENLQDEIKQLKAIFADVRKN